MKLVGIISAAVLSLALATAAPVYAQQEQHEQEEQKPKPAEEKEKHTQPEKPAQQQEKNAKPEEKNAQKQQEKSAPQQQQHGQQAKPEQQAQHAGGNGGGRIPEDRYKAHFGQEHRFRVSRGDYRNHRFQYSGYWFGFVDPWPSNWLYTQDVFVVEIDGVYYLCNASYPGVNLRLSFAL